MFAKEIEYDSVDEPARIRIFDSTGQPLTTVTGLTSGLSLFYWREGEAQVPFSPVVLGSVTAEHLDGGIVHAGAGYYRVDPPDAAWASGAGAVQIGGTLPTGVIVGPSISLVTWDEQERSEQAFTGD